MRFRLLATLLGAGLVSACSQISVRGGIPQITKPGSDALIGDTDTLPDFQRGSEARQRGDLAVALRNLLPLAKAGYPDAQIALAQTYSEADTTEGETEAVSWFRKALPKRPEVDLALARTLLRSDKLSATTEIESLISTAENVRKDPAASSARLDFYSRFPHLAPPGRASELAERLAKSTELVDRLAAINWYRSSLTEPGHVERLAELCKTALDVDLACLVDVAHQLRYTRQRDVLDAHISRALDILDHAGLRPGVPIDLREQQSASQQAANLARSMVDQPEADVAANTAADYVSRPDFDLEATKEEVQALGTARPSEDVIGRAQAEGLQIGVVAYPELADRILRWMQKRGGDFAFEATGVAVGYPFLLRDVDVEKVLLDNLQQGRYHANLLLGELYLFGARTTQNAQLAEKYLIAASHYRSTSITANYRLGRLYSRGLLGVPDPHKAVDNLLEAGRAGFPAAYISLAEFFFIGHGVRINRVNAYVFARRAEATGRPVILRARAVAGGLGTPTKPTSSAAGESAGGNTGSQQPSSGTAPAPPQTEGTGAGAPATDFVTYNLAERLRSEMTPSELAQAEQLLSAEIATRPVIRPPVTAELWNRLKP